MDDTDFTVINTIRSQHLLHRDDSINKTIIDCKDLKEIIRGGVSRLDLFTMLRNYLLQMRQKLNGESIDNEINVRHFFKNKVEIEIFTNELKNKNKRNQ